MTPKRFTIDSESLKKLREIKESLHQAESFPYSENLRSVMDSDVYSCNRRDALKGILKNMARKNISSAIVTDDDNRPVGIVTERDIMQRVVTVDHINIETTPVSQIMTPDPIFLSPESSIYRALSILSANSIKHLPLVENNKVTGIVTMRRLLKLRYPEPMTLMEGIRAAGDTQTLRSIKEKFPALVEARLREGRRASDIVVMISLLNQDIHNRTMELTLAETGPPPASFCLYTTGSHGRLENLLTPDQDHGMIIADNDTDLQYDDYYVELSSLYAKWLNEIGFETCPGYIMCSNPLWRKSLSEWKQQIQFWFNKQVRELARFCTVLFDAAPIYGENALFTELLDFAHNMLREHHEVLRVLHEEAGRHKVPTGLFGRFITESGGEHKGKIDIKRSGLIFVVEAIRILALLHGIRNTSTLKRISALVAGGFIQKDDGDYFEAAYLFLLHLALQTQTENILLGRHGTFINPAKLSQRDRETLRHTYKAVSTLQELVAAEFGALIL